jgi:hypothetical protein
VVSCFVSSWIDGRDRSQKGPPKHRLAANGCFGGHQHHQSRNVRT